MYFGTYAPAYDEGSISRLKSRGRRLVALSFYPTFQHVSTYINTGLTPMHHSLLPVLCCDTFPQVYECFRRFLLTGGLVFVIPDTSGQVAFGCIFSFLRCAFIC